MLQQPSDPAGTRYESRIQSFPIRAGQELAGVDYLVLFAIDGEQRHAERSPALDPADFVSGVVYAGWPGRHAAETDR